MLPEDPRSHCCKPTVLTVGISVLDLVFLTDQIPTEAKKHFAKGFLAAAGGPAVNAAKAISALDGRATLVSRVGKDDFGRMIFSDLAASGVDTARITIAGNWRTSVSAVTIDARGERQILNFRNDGRKDPEPPETDLTGVDVVLGDMRWQSAVRAVFASARAMKIPTVLDADLASEPPDARILTLTDYCIFSKPALAELSGRPSPEEGLKIFQSNHPDMRIAVTCGGAGVYYCSSDLQVTHIAPRRVDVISTLAAGDVFHGAFALAVAQKQDFPSALRFANDVAALRTTHAAEANHFPNHPELAEFKGHRS